MQKRTKQRYNNLRKFFKTKEFTLDEAADLLMKDFEDPKDSVITILSELKKESCLEVKLDPQIAEKDFTDLLTRILKDSEKKCLIEKILKHF